VVGGGPAGSTCARDLVSAGYEVTVLDRAVFPRTKLCAGWVTPDALADLELDPSDYPHRFLTFEKLRLHWNWLGISHASRQHSIRRFEFDDFLLRRSGARVVRHRVRSIEKDGDDFVIDKEFRCRYLVGAGGTACPVYREFFNDINPRARVLQTATLEQEYPFDWRDGSCHLWFFKDGLPGYAWYVPKQDGYVNIGLGGMSVQLKAGNHPIQSYWEEFISYLRKRKLIDDTALDPKGHSDFLVQGGVESTTVTLLAGTLYWLVLAAVFVTLLDALGLRAADLLLERLTTFVPNLILAIGILVFGSLLSRVIGGLVFGYLSNIGSAAAEPIGALARYALLVFVIFMAAEQLAIRTEVLVSAFQIAFAALCLAAALAFGLGGRDWAEKVIARYTRK
jgi:hypothetical protein